MFNDAADERRKGGGLKALAGGLIDNFTGGEIDADGIPALNGKSGFRALQNGKTDVDGIPVENSREACRNYRKEPQPKFQPPTMISPG